jgi:hypothetical protein
VIADARLFVVDTTGIAVIGAWIAALDGCN